MCWQVFDHVLSGPSNAGLPIHDNALDGLSAILSENRCFCRCRDRGRRHTQLAWFSIWPLAQTRRAWPRTISRSPTYVWDLICDYAEGVCKEVVDDE